MIIKVLTPEKCQKFAEQQVCSNYIAPELKRLLNKAKCDLDQKVVKTIDGQLIDDPITELATLFRILSRTSEVKKADLESPVWSNITYMQNLLIHAFDRDQANTINTMVSELKTKPYWDKRRPDITLMALHDGHEELTTDEKDRIIDGKAYLCSFCAHYHLSTTTSSDEVRTRCLISDEKPIAQYCNQFERAGKHYDEMDDK